MRFDSIVCQLLNEMPHISFNHRGNILAIDLKIENYRTNYKGFVDYVKNILNGLNSEDAKQTFIDELRQNKHLQLGVEKLFKLNINTFISNIKS
jgi:hypothetical protein